MKKLVCWFLVVVMGFGVLGLSGCTSTDLSSLEKKIEELELLVSSSDVTELKNKITALEGTISALEGALNSSSETNLALKAQVDLLSTTVTTLSNTLNDGLLGSTALKTEIDLLKTKLANYDADMLKLTDLQSKYDSLENKHDSTSLELKTEIDALKKTLLDYNEIKTTLADLADKYAECVAKNTELKTQIDTMTTTLTSMATSLNTATATITEMEKTIGTITQNMKDANAKILLLEGVIGGSPTKTYGVNETFTFVSGGLQLFSITIDEAWINQNGFACANFTYTNINYPNGYTLDQIFDSKLVYNNLSNSRHIDRYNTLSHKIPIGESFKSADDRPLAYSLGLNENPGVRKVYFGFYNYKYGVETYQAFIPFVCFELDFQPRT